MQSSLLSYRIQSLLCACLLFFILISITNAQSDSYLLLCNQTYGNYTQGSIYQSNLNTVLNSLASNTRLNDFYTTSSGDEPDIVHGLIQCRGDISKEECQSCQNTSAKQIVEQCPHHKTADISYSSCWLSYSGDPSFLAKESFYFDVQNVSKSSLFSEKLQSLLNNLASTAASNASKLTTGSSSRIYGLVQCRRDSGYDNCFGCLQKMFNHLSGWPYFGSQYFRGLSTTCFMRYELYPFFSESSTPSTKENDAGNTNPRIKLNGVVIHVVVVSIVLTITCFFIYQRKNTKRKNGTGKKNNKKIILVAIVVPTVIVSLIATCIFVLLRRRLKPKRDGAHKDWFKSTDPTIFDLDTLIVATNEFSESNKLGQGGFGSVYKGKLPDGQEIAVKRLSEKSHQGLEELKTEVELLAKLQHRNLVTLLGFCLQEEENLLVYEYFPNGSLDKILFDEIERAMLDWDKRYKIMIGIARGLLYIHQDSQVRIIHRDMKAGNILLDEGMIPKISDFGLARLFVESQINNAQLPAGTYGYMAPEYLKDGIFSTKSDVFSFGVLVLEIVAGRKNSSFHEFGNLVSYAWQLWKEGIALELADPTLDKHHAPNEILKCIEIGLVCVQQDADARPTMSEVFLWLNSISAVCPIPSIPAYFVKRAVGDTGDISENSRVTVSSRASQLSVNDLSITVLNPR